MRVVAVLPAYPPKSRVGAFLATHELLSDLHRRGHHVDVLTRIRTRPIYQHEGVTVGPGTSTSVVDVAVACANLVISHAGDDGLASRLAKKWSKPSVRIVHGHHPENLSKLEGASLVVFNSEHLAREVGWPGPQLVVHPPLRPRKESCSGDHVTLVNLSQEKGGELFWRLARKRPDLKFLGVKGGWGFQVSDLGISVPLNMDIVEPTEQMRDVYRRTRILLMPSEQESWGMCALEAAQFGIPTIAHPTPGLLESMGPAASYADRDDEAAWLAQIDRLQNYGQWEDASRKVRLRVNAFDSQVGLDRFAGAIERICDVKTSGESAAVRETSQSEVGEGRTRGSEQSQPEEEIAV